MKILSSFTHPQVVPNLYECLCSAEHKGRYSEECEKQSSSGAPLTSIVFFFLLWKSMVLQNSLVTNFLRSLFPASFPERSALHAFLPRYHVNLWLLRDWRFWQSDPRTLVTSWPLLTGSMVEVTECWEKSDRDELACQTDPSCCHHSNYYKVCMSFYFHKHHDQVIATSLLPPQAAVY